MFAKNVHVKFVNKLITSYITINFYSKYFEHGVTYL